MKILGLDLGVGSIGWALIEVDDNQNLLRINALGSRIVSLTPDDLNQFTKGDGETACHKRGVGRGMRRGMDRRQGRRAGLIKELKHLGMFDESNRMHDLSPYDLWELRARAATEGEQLSLLELGRVLLHLNHKRGYRHSKADSSDNKQTEYVKAVNSRYAEIHELNLTFGQYVFKKLTESEVITPNGKIYTFRKRGQVFPRAAYQEEFDKIMAVQSEFYPDVLTPEAIAKLKDRIFYQRPLKSCKHLVNRCEFVEISVTNKEGETIKVGPKVAPKTSPLEQVCRIYEAINNIRLVNPSNKGKNFAEQFDMETLPAGKLPREARLLQYEYRLDDEERQRIFDYLNTHDKLTGTQLLKELGLTKSDGFIFDESLKNGIKGNETYTRLAEALEGCGKATLQSMLRFDLKIDETVDRETGEVRTVVSPDCTSEPLYMLWHTVYSISDREELSKVLERKFKVTDQAIVDRLFAIDFRGKGYSNKSSKFIRMLIPSLMKGRMYSEACEDVNINHSNSLTKEENLSRVLRPQLEHLQKGALRQPIVEKILNQMINVVNAILQKYGDIDEIRVELARTLKQSKDERVSATKAINKNERENTKIAAEIRELGLKATRRNIQKYKLYFESDERCVYCGKNIAITEFLGAEESEVEHIIPRSVFFDDSMSNKTCACQACNKEKGNRTAFDYMMSKGEETFQKFLERVKKLYDDKKISKTKRDRFLTSFDEIPQDFLNRDLRLTQYISRKARELLLEVCHNVTASSGGVTDFFRHAWGYNDILHKLNFEMYSRNDMVETIEYTHKGQTHTKPRIKDWNKRLDHRHHAIDALVVALTTQGYIQYLNNLSKERDNMFEQVRDKDHVFDEKRSLLEKWAITRPHFSTQEVSQAVDSIAVSFKPATRTTTTGKRYERDGKVSRLAQSNIIIPRGGLHKETIYGKLKRPVKTDIKKALQFIDRVVDADIRRKLQDVIELSGNDIAKASAYLRKNPLTDSATGNAIKVVDCFEDVFVIRSKVEEINPKQIDTIVDIAIREEVRRRYESVGKDQKKFQQSIAEDPITIGKTVKTPAYTVRRYTTLKETSMIPVRRDSEGNPIGYASAGSNHHAAFYRTSDGRVVTNIVSFWTAVMRKRAGLPPIISKVNEAYDLIAGRESSDLTDYVLETLPEMNSELVLSFCTNDMFILGMSDDEFNDAVSANDMKALTSHLYRVLGKSKDDYSFCLHTHTDLKNKMDGAYLRVTSYESLRQLNPQKVTIDSLGNISFDV